MVVDCVVRGDPIPNVTFHKEDQHLQRGDNVSASRACAGQGFMQNCLVSCLELGVGLHTFGTLMCNYVQTFTNRQLLSLNSIVFF